MEGGSWIEQASTRTNFPSLLCFLTPGWGIDQTDRVHPYGIIQPVLHEPPRRGGCQDWHTFDEIGGGENWGLLADFVMLDWC